MMNVFIRAMEYEYFHDQDIRYLYDIKIICSFESW